MSDLSKKIITVLLTFFMVILLIIVLSGCSNEQENTLTCEYDTLFGERMEMVLTYDESNNEIIDLVTNGESSDTISDLNDTNGDDDIMIFVNQMQTWILTFDNSVCVIE